MSCLYTLEINPLSASFANIFSNSEGCLFILFMDSFVVQTFLSVIRSHLFIFIFISITLGGGSKRILMQFMSKSVLPIFSFKSFIGLPWWCSGWESACRCRGHGFEPWSGRIPHAAEQLSPWATITEPARLEPVLRNKRGRNSERPARRDEEWPPLAATRESPRTETKTQHSHK